MDTDREVDYDLKSLYRLNDEDLKDLTRFASTGKIRGIRGRLSKRPFTNKERHVLVMYIVRFKPTFSKPKIGNHEYQNTDTEY